MFKSVFVKSGQGLLSILAFVVTLGVATDALACKFTTGAAHYCSTTRTIGTWAGSFIVGATQFGDYKTELQTTALGLFDAEWFTPDGQSFACTYTDDAGNDFPAFCAARGKCVDVVVGTSCKGGKRTNRATCPTTNGSPGCSGVITVKLTGGATFPDDTDTKDFPFQVANVPASDCNKQFPRINKVIDQGVIAEIITACTTTAPFSDQDLVLSSIWRGDLNDENPSATYIEQSDGPWIPAVLCSPNPATGYPTGACQHDGGAWLTVFNNPDDPAPIVNAELCAASAKDLTCGDQVVDGKVVPGPAPSKCELQDGQCRCRCARCDRDGTLVNLGGGTAGSFVLADPKGVSGTRPWAAVCAVTVTGN